MKGPAHSLPHEQDIFAFLHEDCTPQPPCACAGLKLDGSDAGANIRLHHSSSSSTTIAAAAAAVLEAGTAGQVGGSCLFQLSSSKGCVGAQLDETAQQ
jgi:hypothetical protein